MGDGYRDSTYFEGGGLGYRSYAAQEPTRRRTFRELLAELERRGLTGGRLLEVGCAYGYFLDEARGLFDHRVGTDFSELALERALGRAEELFCGGLDELPPGDPFDCAACIHVIEHVYHPVAFLGEIHRRLRPGGWLVVATPDAGSLWRRLLGKRWPFYKPPEHVTFFDRATLPRLLRSAGFEDVALLPYPGIFALRLVAEKLSIRLPEFLGRLSIRLPGTTVAVCGRKALPPAG
jgi:SAM-dependent methyltransferase